ncbi:MAG: hypothetical protein HC923_06150 [Myxococcales bacterium]|nr:hypothetical protein [Myxococcales bacterium]
MSCATLSDWLGSSPRPDVRLVGADFSNITLEGVDLELAVEVENPYAVELPVVGIDVALSGLGGEFLSTSLTPDAPIPANGSRTVPVPLHIDFMKTLETLSQLELERASRTPPIWGSAFERPLSVT